MIEYGIQMYSLRDMVLQDHNMDGALRTVAKLGYKFVEFAGFDGLPAAEVGAMLQKYGLTALATHTRLHLLTPETIGDTIAYHKALGIKNVIIPNLRATSAEGLEELVRAINYAQPILEAEGLTLGYHNHWWEVYGGESDFLTIEELYRRTSVRFEFDIFWIFIADRDPVEQLRRYADRVQMIHLKDGKRSPTDHFGGIGCALGEGDAPVAAVREYAIEHHLPMVVESEGQNPTGPEEIGRCIRYLRSLEA